MLNIKKIAFLILAGGIGHSIASASQAQTIPSLRLYTPNHKTQLDLVVNADGSIKLAKLGLILDAQYVVKLRNAKDYDKDIEVKFKFSEEKYSGIELTLNMQKKQSAALEGNEWFEIIVPEVPIVVFNTHGHPFPVLNVKFGENSGDRGTDIKSISFGPDNSAKLLALSKGLITGPIEIKEKFHKYNSDKAVNPYETKPIRIRVSKDPAKPGPLQGQIF